MKLSKHYEVVDQVIDALCWRSFLKETLIGLIAALTMFILLSTTALITLNLPLFIEGLIVSLSIAITPPLTIAAISLGSKVIWGGLAVIDGIIWLGEGAINLGKFAVNGIINWLTPKETGESNTSTGVNNTHTNSTLPQGYVSTKTNTINYQYNPDSSGDFYKDADADAEKSNSKFFSCNIL